MKIQNLIPHFKIKKTNSSNNIQKTKPMPLDSVSFSHNIKDNEQKFVALREEISKEMKPIMSGVESACWDFYTESTPENMDKMNAAQDKADNFYDNKETYAKLKDINDAGGVSDKKLQKQLRNLTSAFGDGILKQKFQRLWKLKRIRKFAKKLQMQKLSQVI